MLNHHLNDADMTLAMTIARSASNLARNAGQDISPLEFVLDLATTHNHACPLDFAAMATGNPADVAHDVFGIRRHLDRETGLLTDCFLPRFAARQVAEPVNVMVTVHDRGCEYQVEAGEVFVIKTRHTNTNARGTTWRHRITSAPKVRRIKKLAAAILAANS